MAVSCGPRIPNHSFQSIGLEVEKLAPRYTDDEFFQDEETGASSSDEDEVMDDEDEVMDDEESSEEESEKTVSLLCSRLGLKLDFLDRLQDMSANSRYHRSLRQRVVIFLRNNYTALNSKDKNSLSEKLLHDIGFDPLSSAAKKILTRARSEIREHVADPCEWAEFYIEDEFKYSLSSLGNDGKFPFQSNKTNEWLKLPPWECKLYDDDPLCDVITANVVAKENETSITKELLSGISASPYSQLLFHGTDHQSALDILNGRGIYLPAGSQKRDFSSGKGFYLTDNITSALDWAKSKTVKPAILIFQLRDFSSSNKIRRFSLNVPKDLDKWCEIVSSFRSGKPSVKMEQILSEYDLIEGPVATFRRQSDGQFVFEPQPSSYQVCLISEDFAEKFRHSLHSILFY